MMTALVAIESFALDQVITVGQITTPPQKIHLLPGETITIENLLYATLVASGNDAAEALAAAFPDGREAFIVAMNSKATALHLTNTHFTNPTGFDFVNHYSSALDLARLATSALKNPTFARIVSTPKISVFSADSKIEHKLTNINQLLGRLDGVKGVKTGYTEEAGEALVALTERNGHQILTVVLGSQDRFGETEKLIEWAFSNHQWIDPTNTTNTTNKQIND